MDLFLSILQVSSVTSVWPHLTSGPLLLAQLVAVWRGHLEAGSWLPLQLLCLAASFSLLVAASVTWTPEPGPWPRRAALALSVAATAGDNIF